MYATISTTTRRMFCLYFSHDYYIEMACNTLFGAGDGSQIAPPSPTKTFTLNQAEVALVNVPCEKLYRDIEVLHSFAEVSENFDKIISLIIPYIKYFML